VGGVDLVPVLDRADQVVDDVEEELAGVLGYLWAEMLYNREHAR
jgi:hypothetical protein